MQLGRRRRGAAVAHAAAAPLGVERARRVVDVDEKPRAGRCAAAGSGRRRIARATCGERRSTADGLIHATPTGMAAHPGLPLPAELLQPGPVGRRRRLPPAGDRAAAQRAGRSAAARSTAAGWRSSRPPARSSSSPASSPTRERMLAPLRRARRRLTGRPAHAHARSPPSRSAARSTEKLTAASGAGFDGVELFENDLINSPLSPGGGARARRRPRPDASTSTSRSATSRRCPPTIFARNLRRAEAKFELMRRLGAAADARLLQRLARTRSTTTRSPPSSSARSPTARPEHGVRIAYEALAWGRHVSDYDHAWRIVAAADHPARHLPGLLPHPLARHRTSPRIEDDPRRARSSSSSSPTRR